MIGGVVAAAVEKPRPRHPGPGQPRATPLKAELWGRGVTCRAVDAVVELAYRGRREICIVGDFDAPHARPDGTTWRPGHEGAYRLAEALTLARRRPKIIWPAAPHKDVRAWRLAGAERRDLDAAIRTAKYWRPADG